MTGSQIDFGSVFRQLPVPIMLLTPDFVIADMNLAYLRVSGRTREELLDRHIFAAFPITPRTPAGRGCAT